LLISLRQPAEDFLLLLQEPLAVLAGLVEGQGLGEAGEGGGEVLEPGGAPRPGCNALSCVPFLRF
jgi:hypothetical protein